MSPNVTGRKVIKRACDGCKVRKIKCSEVSPCQGCLAVGIACTFKRHPSIRGPRTLRAKTIRVIAQTQQRYDDNNVQDRPGACPAPAANTSLPVEASCSTAATHPKNSETTSRTPIASLVLRLCVYRLRLYAVWPVVAVEEVMASLQRDEQDTETYALANAIAAATIAQLKLDQSDGDATTASSMEAECQRSKLLDKTGPHVNLNTLRTAFFLHVYHENQEAGGVKSLLFLREAISMAQIMRLHKESTYAKLSLAEQQIRRRILWLLFVTERGVAMLHKLPVVLKANILFPSMDDDDDETQVLPAFQKLINLFWIFDQSGAFNILQNSDTDTFNIDEMESASRTCLNSLQKKLQEVPIDGQSSTDVQRADICVTRQWMRAFLWRVSMNHGRSDMATQATSLSHPIQIAKEFLGVISRLPNAAIEAHGPTMEFKIYEIASAVTESMSNNSRASWNFAERPGEILNQLQRVLASCRGGNKTLISMLCTKIADIQNGPQLLLEPSSRVEEIDSQRLSETTTSPNHTFDLGLDCTTAPPNFISLRQSSFSADQNGFNNRTTAQTEHTELATSLAHNNTVQDRAFPHFVDLPWGSNMVESLSALSPSQDLFEQLLNFNGSFNNVESSGTLDRFLSNTDLWDGTTSDSMLGLIPGNSIFLQ